MSIHLLVFGRPTYNGGNIIDDLKRESPLFGRFFQMIVWRAQPLSTLALFVYYLLYGNTIIRLLDTDHLARPFQGRALPLCALAILGNTLIFLAINLGNVLSLLSEESLHLSKLEIASNLFLLYAMSSAAHFYLFILHYQLYGTYQNLQSIQWQLSGKPSTGKLRQLLLQFTQVASLKRQLDALISVQLCISYFLAAVNSMVLFYMLAFIIFIWPLIIYPFMVLLYYIHLVTYSEKVFLLSEAIVRKFQADEKGKCVRARRGRPVSRLIRHSELHLYLDYFKLTLFSHFAVLNHSFLLATALLLLNYTVFISQT